MASRAHMDQARPGDILRVIHDFTARSPDELSLSKNDLIELIERDDEFGDGWYLGKHLENGDQGLFPEVYTALEPKSFQQGSVQKSAPHASPLEPSPKPAIEPRADGPAPYSLPFAEFKPVTSPQENAPATPPPEYTHDRPIDETKPLQTPGTSTPNNGNRPPVTGPQRSISMAVGLNRDSPVLNETLSKIDEHLGIHTPRHSVIGGDRKAGDSGSEYSSHVDHRLSYIHGQETDEEELQGYSEQEVTHWSPARVAEYLEDVGVEQRYCNVFRDQEIAGEVLLGMDQTQLFIKEFDLGPIGPRLRIWQKIKALQEEVRHTGAQTASIPRSMSDYSTQAEEGATDPHRHRSTSLGTVLPRIPSVMDSPGSSRASRHKSQRTTGSSQLQAPKLENHSPLSSVAPSPGLEPSARPSAASIRNLHHRRHSSIDVSSGAPASAPADGDGVTFAGQPSYHKKDRSFDRSWLMGTETPPGSAGMRPASHGHSLSAGRANSQGTFLRDFRAPEDELDRGYFSGGEVENRKSRNLLRKKDSPAHSRQSSYTSESKRVSAIWPRHGRAASHDSARETVMQMSSAAQVYYGSGKKKPVKSPTEPNFGRNFRPMIDRSPTVTKLEYSKSPSIDAIASSPNIPQRESPTLNRNDASKSPGVQHSNSFFSKQRAAGLRAISDAITGTEKSLVSSPVEMNRTSSREDSMKSPTRTGSSTPSGTSKSLEMEQTGVGKSSTSSSFRSSAMTQSSIGSRRRPKKKISAYTHGLEQKSPDQQMIGCDYSGWMKKKSSNLMTTWKPRLFVLRGRRLSYYYSEHDKEEKGLIDISGHRVLPANNERITGLHAQLTGATTSPTTPSSMSAAGSSNASASPGLPSGSALPTPSPPVSPSVFIFKLVPPRSGFSKGVNFTKPMVHYFAVDSLPQARLWMAALVKATIDRDVPDAPPTTTYQQKTISLERARAMKQRPPALMDKDDDVVEEKREEEEQEGKRRSSGNERNGEGKGLAINLVPEENGVAVKSATTNRPSQEDSNTSTSPPPPTSRVSMQNGEGMETAS